MGRRDPKKGARPYVVRRLGENPPPPPPHPRIEWVSFPNQPCARPGCNERAVYLGVDDLVLCPAHHREYAPSHHRRIDRAAFMHYHALKVRDHLRSIDEEW